MTHVANGSNGLNYAVPKCHASTFFNATLRYVAGSANEELRAKIFKGRVTGENHGDSNAAGFPEVARQARTNVNSTTGESDISRNEPNATRPVNVVRPIPTGVVDTPSEYYYEEGTNPPFMKAQW